LDEVTGNIKEDEVGEACIAIGEMRNPYKILISEPKGKRPPWKTKA
jgi:hypothetical protein